MATPKRMTAAQVRAAALKIAQQVQRQASKGVGAAAVFLSARLKEAVSVPAPRKRSKDSYGNISYRATTRALPGAPPRKLSGKLRQSVTYAVDTVLGGTSKIGVVGVKARSLKGWNYPRTLEENGHPFFSVTVRRYKRDLAKIVGGPLNAKVL